MNLAIVNIQSLQEKRPIDGFTISYLKYKAFNEMEGFESWDFTELNKGKFKNIYYFIKMIGKRSKDIFNEVDYYWFPCPDLEFINIDGMMDFVKKNNLDLCQPSLSKDSMADHGFLITQHKGIRKVPFVEGMCPIFSRKALQKNLWTFDLNDSSYGIDILWGKNNECYVIDDFTVKHPHNIRYPERAKLEGFPDPRQEMIELCTKFGLEYR